jgi:hypothetical protein
MEKIDSLFLKNINSTPCYSKMEAHKLYVQEIDGKYSEDKAFCSKVNRPEDLCDMIKKILEECGIRYSFNELYGAFELIFDGRTTTYKLQVYRNTGPYATSDSEEMPLIVVPTVYGNDRSLSDYQLMRMLGRIIQSDDQMVDAAMLLFVSEFSGSLEESIEDV